MVVDVDAVLMVMDADVGNVMHLQWSLHSMRLTTLQIQATKSKRPDVVNTVDGTAKVLDVVHIIVDWLGLSRTPPIVMS